jgi:hypothetical protein
MISNAEYLKSEAAFRSERGEAKAARLAKSRKPQRFNGTAKVCRKRPSGLLRP